MIRRLAGFITILISFNCLAQVNYQVKVMSWNILNWPASSPNMTTDTANRCPAYRTVVNYANPDILITSENRSDSGIVYFLNQVMNSGPYHYNAGTFINGYDTDNSIYYRDSLFDFVSNVPIQTSLRDINHYTLVFKATGDTLHIFSCHLKAGQGYEPERAGEVAALRQVTNTFAPGTNFLIGGDFNIYEAGEPAYTGLLRDNPGDDGNFLDPINLTGVWNTYSYRDYHTQSTHLNTFGNFSTGGLDDRFDMILYSNGVEQPTGVYYIPGSYVNIGNDGNHFNKDINFGTNTFIPSNTTLSDAIADALFDASDHIPIMLTLSIGPTSDIADIENKFSGVNIYPQPVNIESKIYFTLKGKSRVGYCISDITGRNVFNSESVFFEPGSHSIQLEVKSIANPGFYLLSIKFDNTLISKKIVLSR